MTLRVTVKQQLPFARGSFVQAQTDDSRYPASSPACDEAPSSPTSLVLRNDHRQVSTRTLVPKHQELCADRGVQAQDTSSSEPKWCCPCDPFAPVATLRTSPAMASMRWEVIPGAGIGEDGGRVEQVAEEGRNEELR